VGWGGNPTHLAIWSQPPDTINGSLQVTIQAEEVIQQWFGEERRAVFPHIATFYCCHSWTWNAPSHCHQSLSGTNSWTPWHLLPLKSIVLLFSRIHVLWRTSVWCSHALFCLLSQFNIYTNNVWMYGCMYVRVEAQQLTIDSVARWSRTQSDWCGWGVWEGVGSCRQCQNQSMGIWILEADHQNAKPSCSIESLKAIS